MIEPPSPAARPQGLGDLARWMSHRRKRQLGLLFVLTLAGAVAELLSIGAVIPFLHVVVAPSADPMGLRADLPVPPGGAGGAAAALLVACVAAAAVRLLLAWASQRFIYRLGFDIDAALFRHTVHRPYLLHLERSGNAVLAGFDKVNMLVNTLLLPLIQGAASAVIAVCIVALLVWIDPFAAAITAGTAGLLYLGIALASRRALRHASGERARLATARIKAVREALGGLRDIILDRSQPFHERRFAGINAAYRAAGAHAATIASAPRFVVEAVGIALIGVLAVHFAGRPGGVVAALPVLGALALGAQRLLPLLQASFAGFVQYAAARASLADVLDALAGPVTAPAAIEESPDARPRPFRREIALAGIGFRYGPEGAGVAGVDLRVARGDRIGLIGRTGSGKSTLADLVMGLLPPDAGAILLDGVPLAPDRVAHWQAQVAHVPQAIFLADDTIAANIALSEAPDRAAVEQAARDAQLHDFVATLPHGYDTVVGDRGIRLSGGQRQRIGIARALYRRAEVLILDEATSALDDETEAAVMATIAALGRDLTVIQIAHRLSTLAACDAVYRMEGGRIVAAGDGPTTIAENAVAATRRQRETTR